jgi:ABC-type branched-subunit amino acid transport system ATPase component
MKSSPPGGAVRHRIGLSGDERKLRNSALYLTVRKKIAYACVEHSSTRLSGESAFGSLFGGRHDPVKETAATTTGLFEPSEALGGRPPGELILRGVDTLIFDEPSRGTDESARAEIYNLMSELARQGKGIILLSPDEREINGMCDRVIQLD